MESKFKVGQMVRIIKDTKANSLHLISCELGQVGWVSFTRGDEPDDIYEDTPDFPTAVKFHGRSADIYFGEEELEVVEVDECAATGQTCQFEPLSVPAAFVSGEETDTSCEVIQCRYCGREIGDE